MHHTMFIKIKDLEEQGITRSYISKWYLMAKDLCEKDLLYVTLDNKLPIYPEDIAAYVSKLYISPRKDNIVFEIETFPEVSGDVITDAKELNETLVNGGDYDCYIGAAGKFITLIEVEGRWHRRTYLVK